MQSYPSVAQGQVLNLDTYPPYSRTALKYTKKDPGIVASVLKAGTPGLGFGHGSLPRRRSSAPATPPPRYGLLGKKVSLRSTRASGFQILTRAIIMARCPGANK